VKKDTYLRRRIRKVVRPGAAWHGMAQARGLHVRFWPQCGISRTDLVQHGDSALILILAAIRLSEESNRKG
jgi:hypothetical protein